MAAPAKKTASKGAAAPQSERIDFPARVSPIGAFFVLIPTLILFTIGWTIVHHRMPIYIILLLLVVAGCCGKLLKEAIEDLGPVSVSWTSQGVTVNRLIGSYTFSWSQVEKVEKHDPGATFGDFGRHEDGRAGVGLFIRNPDRKDRAIDAPPDVLILSRCGSDADKVANLADRLVHAKRFAGGKDPRRGGVVPAGGANRPNKAFRKSATVTAA